MLRMRMIDRYVLRPLNRFAVELNDHISDLQPRNRSSTRPVLEFDNDRALRFFETVYRRELSLHSFQADAQIAPTHFAGL